MQELFSKLGIDWRLLIAQIINFTVLLFILYRFLYRPILTVLEKRRERIEKSLEEAARVDAESKRFDQLKMQKVEEAKREAAKVMEETAVQAEQVKQSTLERTKLESEKIVAKAREQIASERESLFKGVQAEAADLVIGVTEKVLKRKMDEKEDRKFIEEAIKHITVSQ
ncbi:MAG: F0F1 ATP synthase subunit B [Patescibacteria group bacterium]